MLLNHKYLLLYKLRLNLKGSQNSGQLATLCSIMEQSNMKL